MNYFEGLQLLTVQTHAQCTAWVDKVFDGYHVLDYCHRGTLLHAVGEEEGLGLLEGPVAWVTWPGPRFRFGNPPEGPSHVWEHWFVAFRGPRVAAFLAGGLFPREQPAGVPIREAGRFRDRFDQLRLTFQQEGHRSPRAVHQLEGLLLLLSEQSPAESSGHSSTAAVRRLIQEVARDPCAEWDFHAAARAAGLSYHHLRRLWRQLAGSPPQQFLLQSRLERAASLLSETDLPIKEIAWITRFHPTTYFNRAFRTTYRLTPTRFRSHTQLQLA